MRKYVKNLMAMSTLLMCFSSMAHAERGCGSKTYFISENVSDNKLLPTFLKDESGLCLDLSKSKALFCWKTARTNIFNETISFPSDHYKNRPLHENFPDLSFYISDNWKGYYEVTTHLAGMIEEPNGSYKAQFENGLHFLGYEFFKSRWLSLSKKNLDHLTTYIMLDREQLTMDHTNTRTLDGTELISRDYFKCRVENPAKLLAFRLKLVASWGEYYANKGDKNKF